MVAIIFIGVLNAAQAGTYKVEVTNEGTGVRVIINQDGRMNNYSFVCKGECAGIVAERLNAKPGEMYKKFLKSNHRESHGNGDPSTEKGLRYEEMDKFISETGTVFSMTDLILKYENIILAFDKKLNVNEISGREASDIIYHLKRKDNTYSIEIFTGEDAKKMASILKE